MERLNPKRTSNNQTDTESDGQRNPTKARALILTPAADINKKPRPGGRGLNCLGRRGGSCSGGEIPARPSGSPPQMAYFVEASVSVASDPRTPHISSAVRRPLTGTSDRLLDDRLWPILLKNSLCADDGKILATRRREARGDLGGHQEQLPSSRRVSWHA